MNAAQILQWLQQTLPPDQQNRVNPKTGQTYISWLKWVIQSSPNKAAAVQSVANDIQNGTVDISQINTNAEYNVQQATATAARVAQQPKWVQQQDKQDADAGDFGVRSVSGKGSPPNQASAPPSPTSSTWNNVQQMLAFIQKGGDQNLVSQAVGMSHPNDPLVNKPSYDTTGLVSYVDKLPKNQQKTALASIQQFLKDRSGWTPLQQKDVNDALNQARRDIQATYSAKAPSAATAPSSESAMQAITSGFNTGTAGLSGQKGVDQSDIEWLAQVLGTDPNTLSQQIEQFANHSQVQVTNINGKKELWTYGGYTPTQSGWTITGEVNDPKVQKGQQANSYTQAYIGMLYSNLAQTAAGVALLQYEQTNGQLAPDQEAAFRQAMIAATNQQLSNPNTKQETILQLQSFVGSAQAMMPSALNTTSGVTSTTATGLSSLALPGWLAPAVADFSAEYGGGPAKELQGVTTALQSALGDNWQQSVPMSQVQAMTGWSQQEITDYVNNLPDPAHPGFTVGAWSQGYNTVLQAWQQNFGGSSTPTTQQVTALMGMNQTQQADYFYNSPSPVSGMNNGTYKGYDTLINNVRNDLTPSMGSDFISSLTQKLNPTQQAAANAANLKPGTAAVAG